LTASLSAGFARSILGETTVAVAATNDSTRETVASIQFQRPSTWVAQHFGTYCRRVGPGVVVSNVRRHFRHPVISNGCTNNWILAGLPRDYVLIDVSEFAFPIGQPPKAMFPLSLSRFRRARPSGCRCAYWETSFSATRREYEIRVWIGTKASRTQRRAVENLIASIKPR